MKRKDQMSSGCYEICGKHAGETTVIDHKSIESAFLQIASALHLTPDEEKAGLNEAYDCFDKFEAEINKLRCQGKFPGKPGDTIREPLKETRMGQTESVSPH